MKKNRSDRYQNMFNEISYSQEMLADFAIEAGLTAKLNSYNETLLELKSQLRRELWRLVDTALTPRQRQVIRLYAQGYTQTEIAKMLNVNQSSITKSINGNCDYRNGKKVYGGARKKLRKLAEKDQKIQDLIRKMEELADDDIYS